MIAFVEIEGHFPLGTHNTLLLTDIGWMSMPNPDFHLLLDTKRYKKDEIIHIGFRLLAYKQSKHYLDRFMSHVRVAGGDITKAVGYDAEPVGASNDVPYSLLGATNYDAE